MYTNPLFALNLKNYLFVLLFFVKFIGFSQNTYVPDDNFEQALIDLGYDTGPLNDFVPTANIVGVEILSIQARGVVDLTGIEDFTSLTIFNCTDNLIASLDLSSNTNLQILNADRNLITNVNVSQNTLLESFFIGENLLTNIDISQNILLKYFFCSTNQITSVNIENNTNLISLSCFDNLISSFTIPLSNSLEELEISGNLLTSLDVLNGSSIRVIYCVENQLSNLDVSNCLDLDVFLFSDNNISSINLSNNNALFGLWCENNPLADLDLSQNLDLEILRFGGTLLTNLDISNNNKLYRVIGNNNQYMRTIDLRNGNNPLITDFSVINNPELSCILVDNPIYSDSNWLQKDPSTSFVSNQTECENLSCDIEADNFNDITAIESFVLPNLVNGNYFTGTNGTGSNLSQGDTLFTSQRIYIYYEDLSNPACNNESDFYITINIPEVINDFFIPKYFTPNNDGFHDYWQIEGISNYPNAVIDIYDRYGKLLKQLNSNDFGWDGTFNGKALGSNDFWFIVDLGNDKPIEGHFTLKR